MATEAGAGLKQGLVAADLDELGAGRLGSSQGPLGRFGQMTQLRLKLD